MITGANSGIGYHAAVELARRGATVVLACRDRARGEQSLASLHRAVPGAMAELLVLDLASFASIREAARHELATGLPLHLLINNAGVMTPPRRLETSEGFELQFGTNVLGHFHLTALLLPSVERAGKGRIVTVSSIVHKSGRLHFEDPNWREAYRANGAYGQSKLANLMFAFELERRLRATGSSITSLACHPGVASTRLFVNGDYPPVEKALRVLASCAISLFLNTSLQGALPILFAATSEQARGGGYYGPQGFREMRGGDAGPAFIAPQAHDGVAAKRLWNLCEELTGVRPFSSAQEAS